VLAAVLDDGDAWALDVLFGAVWLDSHPEQTTSAIAMATKNAARLLPQSTIANVYRSNLTGSLLRIQILTDEEVARVGFAGPGPVVDEPPRAQAVHLAGAVLVERVLDRRL